MPDSYQQYRSAAQKIFTRLSLVLLLYEALFQIGGSIIMDLGGPLYSNPEFSLTAIGIVSVLAVYMILGSGGPLPIKKADKMTPLVFIWLFFLVYGLQLLSAVLSDPLICFLNDHGFAMEYAQDIATGEVLTFWGVLYSVIAAPLIEELLFRQMLFVPMRRFGCLFAVLISGLNFGLMHGNIIQFPTAFIVGCLLAWVRDRYGLLFSILLHVSNNLVAIIGADFPDEPFVIAGFNIILLGGVICLFATLTVNARKIIQFFRQEHGFRYAILWYYTTPMVIIMTLIYLSLTFLSIFS